MSILIRGMEMPKTGDHPFIVWVHPTGEATIYKYAVGAGYGMYTDSSEVMKATAVHLPEGHGRLIDADAMMEYFTSDSYWLSKLHKTQDGFDKETWTNEELRHLINKAPTIIPAEGGTE